MTKSSKSATSRSAASSCLEFAADLRKTFRHFPPERPYLIGVSGGRDSIALLHILLSAGYGKLTVCHLDHQLRPRSSRADARFVSDLAAALRLRFEIESTDVRRFATENKMSLETAARACRYQFFAQVAKRTRCHTIFLGHHADDLVETLLLNLLRGAGLAGLSAMREVSTRKIDATDLTIVRPLLAVWRSDIDDYVRKYQLRFREDRSNKIVQPLRNRIRHLVIPYLEKTLGRKVRQNIWRTAEIAGEEERFFELLLPARSPSDLAVKPLQEMPVALQRRALRRWLRDANVPDVGFDLVERIRDLLDLTARVAKTNLPRNRHARRRAGKLFIV